MTSSVVDSAAFLRLCELRRNYLEKRLQRRRGAIKLSRVWQWAKLWAAAYGHRDIGTGVEGQAPF